MPRQPDDDDDPDEIFESQSPRAWAGPTFPHFERQCGLRRRRPAGGARSTPPSWRGRAWRSRPFPRMCFRLSGAAGSPTPPDRPARPPPTSRRPCWRRCPASAAPAPSSASRRPGRSRWCCGRPWSAVRRAASRRRWRRCAPCSPRWRRSGRRRRQEAPVPSGEAPLRPLADGAADAPRGVILWRDAPSGRLAFLDDEAGRPGRAGWGRGRRARSCCRAPRQGGAARTMPDERADLDPPRPAHRERWPRTIRATTIRARTMKGSRPGCSMPGRTRRPSARSPSAARGATSRRSTCCASSAASRARRPIPSCSIVDAAAEAFDAFLAGLHGRAARAAEGRAGGRLAGQGQRHRGAAGRRAGAARLGRKRRGRRARQGRPRVDGGRVRLWSDFLRPHARRCSTAPAPPTASARRAAWCAG